MRIIDNFKEKIEKMKARRKERLLINKADDEKVLEELPPEQDNSNINIKEVVKSMENPEVMVEVVENNLKEIIDQNNVRDTLKHLNDDDILKILEENKEEIEENNKTYFAIEAIKSTEKKLKTTFEKITKLTDLELAQILNGMKSEKKEEKKNKIEQEKIKLVSMKILEHIIKHGSVWHLSELTGFLSTDSKMAVADLCINSIDSYEENKNKMIDTKVKTKFLLNIYRNIDISYDEKNGKMDEYVKKGVLAEEEAKFIKDQMKIEELEKEDNGRGNI